MTHQTIAERRGITDGDFMASSQSTATRRSKFNGLSHLSGTFNF